MKIERVDQTETTIQEFARKNDLTMQIIKRRTTAGFEVEFVYDAQFKDVKLHKANGYNHGRGYTEDKAIDDYAKLISERKLLIRASGRDQYKVHTQKFSPYVPDET